MLDRKPRRTERFRNFFLEFYRSKSDHNSGSQTSLPKDAKKRRDGILELSSSSTRFERGRKDGMQEGFSMPQSYKKRKDGVQEGVSQPELVGSNSADGWVRKKLSLHTAYPPPPRLPSISLLQSATEFVDKLLREVNTHFLLFSNTIDF